MITCLNIILIVCVVSYVGFAATVYIAPHLFLYHPDTSKPSLQKIMEKIPNIQEVSLSDITDAYGWYVKPEKAKKAVVFFHGNSDNASYFLNRARPFVGREYAVLVVEYQGFGGRKGYPNQISMQTDVELAVAFLNKQGFDNKNIVLYGHSMGTYLAIYGASSLGQIHPFNSVILESPFTSVVDMAKRKCLHLFPVRLLLKKNVYDSIKYIRYINTRILIGHGMKDKTVPYDQGERLFEQALKPKEFFSSAEAGHRELPAYGFIDEVLRFLEEK